MPRASWASKPPELPARTVTCARPAESVYVTTSESTSGAPTFCQVTEAPASGAPDGPVTVTASGIGYSVSEVATLNKISTLEAERGAGGGYRWDPILVDLDATGHAVMLLNLPKVMDGLIGDGPGSTLKLGLASGVGIQLTGHAPRLAGLRRPVTPCGSCGSL